MHYQVITTNVKPLVRNDTMQDREWVVVPMVMIVEGVLNGNYGPIYYPFEEMSVIPAIWNHKPVVVYHPEGSEANGSACTKEELDARSIGVIMNAEAKEGKLLAEAWLDPDRIETVDSRIMEAIKNETVLELSTGLFMDIEEVSGEYNGVEYKGIARNFRPDHLAVLPDVEGACSVSDGAGFIRLNMKFANAMVMNEVSFEDVRSQLQMKIREGMADDEWAYVENVFDKKFVYEKNNKLYQQDYTKDGDEVKLVGVPVEVIRVISYEMVKNTNMKGSSMEKEKVVNDLIANESTQWTEDDRETLMALNDDALEKMAPVIKEPEKTAVQNAAEEGAADLKPDTKETPESKELTVNEYIEKVESPEIRRVLRQSVSTYNAKRDALIEKIVSNERNTFTKEYLASKDVEELEAIAKLAEPVQVENASDNRFDYSGQAPVTTNSNEEPLGLPSTASSAE